MILEKVDASHEKTKDLKILIDISSCTNGNLDRIQFMLCGSCFWCASLYASKDNISTEKCPLCHNESIELLPIYGMFRRNIGTHSMPGGFVRIR
jgi:hypothetical protein